MNEQRYRLYRRIAKAAARLDRALAEKVKAEAEYSRLLAEYFPPIKLSGLGINTLPTHGDGESV